MKIEQVKYEIIRFPHNPHTPTYRRWRHGLWQVLQWHCDEPFWPSVAAEQATGLEQEYQAQIKGEQHAD